MSTAMTWKHKDLDTPEKRSKYTVCIIGTGSSSLLTACLFAEAGFRTVCVDSNPYMSSLMKRGKAPFTEAELGKQVKKHAKTGKLTVADSVKEAVSRSDVIVFSLHPTIDQKKKPDYSQTEKATIEVGRGLRSGSLIVVESLFGPGITENLFKDTVAKVSGLKAGTDFGLACSPADSLPHCSLREVAEISRVVGAIDEQSLKAALQILSLTTKAKLTNVKNIRTAEAVGLFQTVYKDVKHALANELAHFCEKTGVDFFECQKAVNAQLGSSLPAPDITAGYFLPHPYMLFEGAENNGAQLRLAEHARKVNEEMLSRTVHLTKNALRACGKTVRRSRVTVLGVSGRANTKDVNQFFAKNLVAALSKNGVRVRVYDPFFSSEELTELGYQAEGTLGKSVEGADCLLIAVGHERFRRLNLTRLKFFVKQPSAIVDVCNVIEPIYARKEGFCYSGLGMGQEE